MTEPNYLTCKSLESGYIWMKSFFNFAIYNLISSQILDTLGNVSWMNNNTVHCITLTLLEHAWLYLILNFQELARVYGMWESNIYYI